MCGVELEFNARAEFELSSVGAKYEFIARGYVEFLTRGYVDFACTGRWVNGVVGAAELVDLQPVHPPQAREEEEE